MVMEEENEDIKLTMDEEAQMQLLVEANVTQRGFASKLPIDGKVWHIRSTSQKQNVLMQNYDYDVLHWQNKIKESNNVRLIKRLNKKIRKAYAKKAAHKVLGKRLWLIPFVFAYMWRRIYNESEKVSATINSTETIGENKVFYLANLGSSKQALALSMTNVGDAVKQRIQRGESAESLVEQDGLPKKEESKSAAPSKRRGITKK